MTGVNVLAAAVMRLAMPLLKCCGDASGDVDDFRAANGTRTRDFVISGVLQIRQENF